MANAFITPLLLAGLAEMVPADRFGREVGIYSSFQAVGGGLGPLVGGLAADSSWQGAFVGTAVVAGLLALMPPDGDPRPGAAAPQLRPLLTRRMVLLGLGFFFIAAGPVGIAVLVGVVARDVLALSGTATGLILLGGALAAMTLGPLWGWILDRQGASRIAPPVILAATASSVALALGRTGWALGLLWIVGGAFAAFVVVVFQSLGATLLPDNRGGHCRSCSRSGSSAMRPAPPCSYPWSTGRRPARSCLPVGWACSPWPRRAPRFGTCRPADTRLHVHGRHRGEDGSLRSEGHGRAMNGGGKGGHPAGDRAGGGGV